MADATFATAARRMRLLQIGTEWFTPISGGGLARSYADMFRALPMAGADLAGLVAGPDRVAELTGGRVRCFTGPGASFGSRLLGARHAIDRALRAERFDAVGCHFALYGAPALDRLRGLPLVVHFHGPWAAESRHEGQGRAAVALKHLLERLVYRRAQRVIVLSHAFAALAARSYHVPEDRLRVVPGSINVARFAIAKTRTEARRQLGWPTDRPILLAVRRLAARMGLGALLEAMARIVRRVPDAVLHIAGKGALAAPLRDQAAALGLKDHVRFLGFVPDADLPAAYRAADINVLPSEALEGFGLSAAEALAAGTPSMVTPVGGLPEVVGPLSPDLIFRSGAVDDLADGLIAALRGDVRMPADEACRRYAAQCFDPALNAHRMAAVYREIV